MSKLFDVVALPSVGLILAALAGHSAAPADLVVPNDNLVPGGMLRGGMLTIHLEAREGLWRPMARTDRA